MDINATFIVQIFVFLVLCIFTAKYVWPPLRKAIDDRNQQIADGLTAADRAERELADAKGQADEELQAARQRASGIVEAANKRANQMVEEAKDQATAEGDKIIAAANAEVEQQVIAAKETLRKEISSLALQGAEKVLEKEVDKSAHSKLVEEFADKL